MIILKLSLGCGGYMIDEGIITNNPNPRGIAAYFKPQEMSSCEWFIESSGNDSTILLKEIMNLQPRYSFLKVCTIQRNAINKYT